MSDETIHDDIRSINETLRTMSQGQADNAATLRVMNERLFLPGGVLPAMWNEIKEVRTCADAAKTAAEKVNGKVNTQRAYVAGASAMGLFAGGIVKGLLGKLGVHF